MLKGVWSITPNWFTNYINSQEIDECITWEENQALPKPIPRPELNWNRSPTHLLHRFSLSLPLHSLPCCLAQLTSVLTHFFFFFCWSTHTRGSRSRSSPPFFLLLSSVDVNQRKKQECCLSFFVTYVLTRCRGRIIKTKFNCWLH